MVRNVRHVCEGGRRGRGDRHLLQMSGFRGVRILKAADFLEIVPQEKGRKM